MEFGASHQATTINCDMLTTNKQNHKFAVFFTYTSAVKCTEIVELLKRNKKSLMEFNCLWCLLCAGTDPKLRVSDYNLKHS